jgi:hypothetical protein
MRRLDVWIALLFVFLLSASNTSYAQLIRGFVSGTVTDSGGAVVPAVFVTLTNTATGIAREAETNGAGFYRFVAVEPGEYSVEFRFPGFETRRAGGLVVRTAQEVVLDQTLSAGGITTDVSVVETPGVDLNKTTATVERTFSHRVTIELPLQIYSGVRDISRLALLAPGVVRAPSFTEFSANGQRSRNNNFMLDGVDNNDLSVTLNSLRVIPEAVEEIQVQTASYSAEFGRSSGAQFSAVTRGGTNGYHGDVWEYYRGNWMEPLSLTNKRAGIKETPRFVLNQFGGDAGGPVIKNRTFFFALLDGNRRREAPSASNAIPATIPTPAGYASLQNVPLGPGETPAARQAALSALGFLPDIHNVVSNYQTIQNVTINTVPIQTGTIRIPVARPANFWYSVGRVDHRLTERDSITYRYHFDQSDQSNTTSNLQFGERFAADQAIRRQNHAISSTRVFTNRFLNEARLAYTRGRLSFPEHAPSDPTVAISGFFTIGGLNAFPQGRIEQLYQFQNVASYMADRHSLKFGVDVRRNKLFARAGMNSKGTWMFSSLADFLNNNAFRLDQAVSESTFDATQWNNAYFFQDDIKLGKHWTVNAGMRYEYSTVPLGFFGATDPAIQAVGVPGPASIDKNNWASRFGFAYGKGQTSIRGGFGTAYDVLFYALLNTTSTNYPRVVNSTTTAPATANLFPSLAPKVATIPPLNPALTFVNVPQDTERPTTNFWSLSVQRQFGPSHVLEAGYLGNRSYHQIRQRESNPGVLTAEQAATVLSTGSASSVTIRRLNPNWGPRTLLEAGAKAEYHAGYVRFDRRLTRGVLAGVNYTWSGTFSDNDEAYGGNDVVASSPQVPQNFFNYHNEWSRSAFDRPHRFAVHYLYEVPWFSSGWASQALGKILGGWQISGITEVQSGQPFTIRTGVDTVGSLAGAFPGRPDYRPKGVFLLDPVTEDLRTFTIPIDGTGIVTAPIGPNGILANSMPGGGNLGRNTFRGPGFQNWNFSLLKKVIIRENVQVQIRGDFANLWNHNNFQNPVAVMSSPTFGQNTAPPVTDTRQILLSAKLRF